jgi:toxin HigB-1
VRVSFKTQDLADLENADGDSGFPSGVARSYQRRIGSCRAANVLNDLIAMRSNGFEKLKGRLNGSYSMRLNDQWRMILELRDVQDGIEIHVTGIVDYH